ncbi:MAG: hypothetical protein AVDCRST_MAG02-135 [uncultured Rubrobacteraceae bacterium]|uniref:Uncharacterized protein n=1 Tax=uncultured Rubrobacteraceae bacterium TaxID=349277 RepID=A0A6J4QMN0_9ACTN|nr:MAG: hypothetical protein AVDCRST_MAG02-135 [uncultured Rubrobacteraceae bacterium]
MTANPRRPPPDAARRDRAFAVGGDADLVLDDLQRHPTRRETL